MSQVAFACIPVAVGLWFAPVAGRYICVVFGTGVSLFDAWRDPRGTLPAQNSPDYDNKAAVEAADLARRFNSIHANAGEVCQSSMSSSWPLRSNDLNLILFKTYADSTASHASSPCRVFLCFLLPFCLR